MDHRTPLTREHHELIINQAAHARKIVEELFQDWHDFPPLSDDEESLKSKPVQGTWASGPPSNHSRQHPYNKHSIHHHHQKRRLATVGVQLPSSVIVTSAIVQIEFSLISVTATSGAP